MRLPLFGRIAHAKDLEMAAKYTGSLSLEWYNKQKSIILQAETAPTGAGDIPAPRINWINKDQALFYEIDEKEGKGLTPYWVDRNDIRVKETRPLVFQKAFKAVPKKTDLTGQATEYKLIESKEDDPEIENILIRGDNLLALNTLKKMFDQKPDEEKVKCIYIDPPYNTEQAFKKYDDNLEISEWLSLMRDRLYLLKDILKQEGILFVSIDDNLFNLKVLLDEIFGRKNFCGYFVWEKKKKPAFLSKMGTLTELILVYAKNKQLAPDFIYGLTTEGKKYPINNAGNGVNTITFPIGSVRFNFKDKVFLPQDMSEGNIITRLVQKLVVQDYYNQTELVLEGEWRYSQATLNEIIEQGDEIYIAKSPFRPNHIKKGGEAKKIHNLLSRSYFNIDTYEDASKHSTELFGKDAFDYPKPESLIHTLLSTICNEDDIVLDCFGGSGTTYATCHKNKLRWLGVEIGSQADSHIIPRMKKVIAGQDTGGISSLVHWNGGGAFKYYRLGSSIIQIDKHGKGDFNWQLGRTFIEESLLASYDYTLDGDLKFSKQALFDGDKPSVGINKIGTKIEAAVCSLNEPGGPREMMLNQEIRSLYDTIKAAYNPEFITIFTNRGVELALEAKPENMEIIKVPHAIFAELEN